MRILIATSMAFLYMCGFDDPAPPVASHGGVIMTFGAQPLEVVAHGDGHIAAFPVGASAIIGPATSVIVHVPGTDGVVHPTPLAWDAPTASFVGTMPVAPAVGPIAADAVIAGTPVHASAPVFVVLAPVAPVVVGSAPETVDVRTRGHGHVEVVAPQRPGVVVEAPRPGVVVEAPRPVFVEPPRPAVVIEPPRPPGVVFVEPRPGIVVEHDRDGDFDERRGHWDHGRHGGEGPEWHGGEHGHGHDD